MYNILYYIHNIDVLYIHTMYYILRYNINMTYIVIESIIYIIYDILYITYNILYIRYIIIYTFDIFYILYIPTIYSIEGI